MLLGQRKIPGDHAKPLMLVVGEGRRQAARQPDEPLPEIDEAVHLRPAAHEPPALERHRQQVSRGPQPGHALALPANLGSRRVERVVPSDQALGPIALDGKEGRCRFVKERKQDIRPLCQRISGNLSLPAQDADRRAERLRGTGDIEDDTAMAGHGGVG